MISNVCELSKDILELQQINASLVDAFAKKEQFYESEIKFLKEKDVNVLVSTRFGKNINLVNKHFIPVKISLEQQDEIIDILNKHLHWIKDEWDNKSSGFKLFTIKSGILKSSIDK